MGSFWGYSLHIVIGYPITNTLSEDMGSVSLYLESYLNIFHVVSAFQWYRVTVIQNGGWYLTKYHAHLVMCHYSDVIMLRWRLKSPASPLFSQPFIQAQLKEYIKAPRHWPLWREFTGEFPAKRASNADNVSIWWRHHSIGDDKVDNIQSPAPVLIWDHAI